jgi:hypothetical protein
MNINFPSDFHRFSNFNNFSNFEARNLLDHLNESPGSPLSDFTTFRGLSSVFQKIGRGRKLTISWKFLKLVARMMRKIAKNWLTEFYFYFTYIYILIHVVTKFGEVSIIFQCFRVILIRHLILEWRFSLIFAYFRRFCLIFKKLRSRSF